MIGKLDDKDKLCLGAFESYSTWIRFFGEIGPWFEISNFGESGSLFSWYALAELDCSTKIGGCY